MPHKPTQERFEYIDRTTQKPDPIVRGIIQIGRYKGKSVDWVSKNDPRWFKWACENVRDFKSLSGVKVTWR